MGLNATTIGSRRPFAAANVFDGSGNDLRLLLFFSFSSVFATTIVDFLLRVLLTSFTLSKGANMPWLGLH